MLTPSIKRCINYQKNYRFSARSDDYKAFIFQRRILGGNYEKNKDCLYNWAS